MFKFSTSISSAAISAGDNLVVVMDSETEPKAVNFIINDDALEQNRNLEDESPMLSDDGSGEFKRSFDCENSTDHKNASRNEKWRLVFVLLLGQLLSFFLALTSFISSYFADLGVDTPLTQSSFTYISMAVVYGGIILYRRQKLMVPWYWYVILAFIDVQANYLFVRSYQYSSITSVTLLDCWTIPWVMILTWLVLRTRYSLWQFFGAAICIVGLVLVVLSDSRDSGGGGKNPLLGDTLVVAGTFCFAFSNVGEEFCAKKKDRIEFLAMLGAFGVVVSVCEISLFERKDLALVKWSPTIVALFAGFAAAAFLFNSLTVHLLKMSGATLFNLSLLTSDMWAVLIRIFFYRQQVDLLYYVAFATVAVGLIIYSLNDTASNTEEKIEDEEAKPLTGESSTP